MRRAITVLVVAGALAALFVSASRAPRIVTRTFESRLVVVAFSGALSSCSASPLDGNVVCGTHEAAERLAARFGKSGLSPLVHKRTVVIPSVFP